jgi:hypothetical protein
MNGAHDCGGMMGFGPVRPEACEPVFHAPWEARMFALMNLVGDIGGWSIDEDRSACESMAPGDYITSSYYEHWLHGAETLLQKHGLATRDEIASGRAATPGQGGNADASFQRVACRHRARQLPAAGSSTGLV